MNKIVKENRVGKVFLLFNLLDNLDSNEEINAFFKDFLIIRAEWLRYREGIEYIGYNPQFQIVSPGNIGFEYDYDLTIDNGKIIAVDWLLKE